MMMQSSSLTLSKIDVSVWFSLLHNLLLHGLSGKGGAEEDFS